MRGWKTNAATAFCWQGLGGRIVFSGSEANAPATLWTEKDFGDAEFVLDCRPFKSKEGKLAVVPTMELRGAGGKGTEVKLEGAMPDSYQRFIITVKGREVTVKHNDQEAQRLTLPVDAPARGALGLRSIVGVIEFMNLYAREIPSH